MPKGLSFNDLKTRLKSIPGVEAVHDLHVWSLTVGTDALSVHLVIGMYVHGLTIMTVKPGSHIYNHQDRCDGACVFVK